MSDDAVARVDGYDIRRRHALEELRNVVKHYPLWPGDTISHHTAKACEILGWIERQGNGNWIPTAEGLRVYDEEE